MPNILDKCDKSMAPTPGSSDSEKASKFNWARPASPGVMRFISKHLLNIDDTYQREKISNEAVLKIARNWDWALFGVLSVAERLDGSFWVFEGGHRARASFYRRDVTDLPCILFKLADISEEARVFIAASRMRSLISPIDTFKASAVALEPAALKTREILGELGIVVAKTAHKGKEVKCIHTIQKRIEQDEEKAKRVLKLCLGLAGDEPVSAKVFTGIFMIVQHFNGKDVLEEYSEEFAKTTQSELDRAIRSLSAEMGKGGEVVYAKGILNILNKGKRTRKLSW